MTLLAAPGSVTAARSRRPAVVEPIEPIEAPRSTSDGRVAAPTSERERRTSGSRSSSAAAPGRGLRQQVLRFAAIGVVSTLAWAALYSLLRGAGLGSVAANAIALVTTAIGNTAANRRLTFGVTGREGLARDHGAGLVAFGLAIALTTTAATLLDRFAPGAHRLVEIAVLSAANVAATVGRFVLLRAWIGRAAPLGIT